MAWKRNKKSVVNEMKDCILSSRIVRSVVVLPPFHIDLSTADALICAKFIRRKAVEEMIELGVLKMLGNNAAIWTDEGIRARSRKRSSNRSKLDYFLMDWDKLEDSTPIDRTARLVTYQAQSVSLNTA